MLYTTLLPLAAVGWISAGSAPAAAPPTTVVAGVSQAIAQSERQTASETVEVVLYDENHPETHVVHIGRDGVVDDATRQELERLFRCKRTERHRPVDKGLLAMLADVADHYPGHTIDFVSAFRATDRHSSRHYQGR